MLPSSNRLNLKKDFKWVRSGKGFESRFFRLFVRLGDNERSRIGIATSAKVFNKATDRNRSRRLLSSAFESLFKSLPNNINIIALPKKPILEVKSGDVLLELESILKGAKIL
jgi:ribonuclease P protein component